jgi:hypothetical protein
MCPGFHTTRSDIIYSWIPSKKYLAYSEKGDAHKIEAEGNVTAG